MARCLVLGANGFIGSHLVDALIQQNHFVRCFDRYTNPSVIWADQNNSHIEIFDGDFASPQSIEAALDSIDYVFHFISTTNPFSSEKNPKIDLTTNIPFSIELFELCAKKNIKRIIFPSTSAIYGDHAGQELFREDDCPLPVSPYAIGKLAIESYLRFYNKKIDLPYLVLRIANPFGPRQNPQSNQGVIATFLHAAAQSEPITIYGDGSMVRDYLYIEDLAEMIVGLFQKETKYSVYNLGSGVGQSIQEIAATVEKVTGHPLAKKFIEAPASFVKKVVLDTSRLTSEFEVAPKTSLEDGIRKTWEYIQNVPGKQPQRT